MARPFAVFLRRFSRNRTAAVGLLLVVGFVTVAALAPMIAPHDPYSMTPAMLRSPEAGLHLLGTDNYGRDILSGLVYGARVSLAVGLLAALVSLTIGVAVGAIAGYFGGSVDALLMRMSELFQMIPTFFLALIIIALTGSGIGKVIVVIGVLSWPPTARLIRAQVLSLRESDFVEAGRAQGYSHRVLLVREILPNAIPPAIVQGSLDIAQAILLEANLSFFGLGDPSVMSWGTMLHNAQQFVLMGAWWLSIYPGVCIFLTVFAFNVIGDGLNDALNPRLKE